MARCYPNTYVQQRNALERCGQAIVGKIRSNDQKEPVTKAEAQAIFDASKGSYNQGKSHEEQLQ